MRQGPRQQILITIIIVISVIMTLLGSAILVIAERPRVAGRGVAASDHNTATPFRILTLAPTEVTAPGPAVTVVTFPTDLSPTVSPTLADTATFLPTPTPVTSPTPTSLATTTTEIPVPCEVPEGWVTYQVQPGENLYRIGLKFGLTVDQLVQANCLSSVKIKSGQIIYVPPVTPKPDPTSGIGDAPLTPSGTPTSSDDACTCSGSIITFPQSGATLSGSVVILGTASLSDFLFYKLEIRPSYGGEDDYITLSTAERPVTSGALGKVDTAAWPDGQYWLRLTVVNTTYNYPDRCARLYTFDN